MADLVVPALGESITEAVISKWLVQVGDHVDADTPVCDLETDKITVQLPAPAAGALSEQRFSEGDTVKVGDVVGQIDTAAKGSAKKAPAKGDGAKAGAAARNAAPAGPGSSRSAAPKVARAPEAAAPTPAEVVEIPERDAAGRVLSPARRRALREGGEAAAQVATPAPAPAAPAARAPTAPAVAGDREELVPMSPLRKRIAERLVQAQQSSASLTTFNEVDMSAIIALRKQYQEEFVAKHGIKLGFMSFAVKAAVAALKLYPGLNAEVRGDSIVYKKHYDIGVAVSTDRGLVVPVLRDCDRLSFAEIEQGIADLARKARDGKLVLDDLVGGTFSITNGGIYGSMMSTPLLNFPQTGILGMHNIVQRPVAVGDAVEVRPVMFLAVTYDHRVVDGRESVQFLVAIKERMEQPDRLLFGV